MDTSHGERDALLNPPRSPSPQHTENNSNTLSQTTNNNNNTTSAQLRRSVQLLLPEPQPMPRSSSMGDLHNLRGGNHHLHPNQHHISNNNNHPNNNMSFSGHNNMSHLRNTMDHQRISFGVKHGGGGGIGRRGREGYRPQSIQLREESARMVDAEIQQHYNNHNNNNRGSHTGGKRGTMRKSMVASQLGYYQEYPATSLAGLIPDANIDQVYRLSRGTGLVGSTAAALSRAALDAEEAEDWSSSSDDGGHPTTAGGVGGSIGQSSPHGRRKRGCCHAKPISSCWCCCGSSEAHFYFHPRLFFPFCILLTGNFRHIYVIRSSRPLKETFGLPDDTTSNISSTAPFYPRNYSNATETDELLHNSQRSEGGGGGGGGGASRAMAATVNRPLYINVPMLFVSITLIGFMWLALWMAFGSTFAPKGELFRAITVALTAGLVGSFGAWIWGFPAAIGILWLGILYQQIEVWLGIEEFSDMSSIPTEVAVPYNPSIYSSVKDSQSVLSDGFGGRYLMPMKLLCICLVLLRSSFTLGSGLSHPFALGRILLLALLPLAVDAIVSGMLANYLFDYGGDMGWIFLHGFVCAPLSTSVMLLGVLFVQSKGRGNDGGPLQLILPANSIDAALGTWFCTIALSVVLNDVSVSEGVDLQPGAVEFGSASTATQIIQSVCEIVGGLLVGGGCAMLSAFFSSQLFAIDLPHWYNREGFFATSHMLSNALVMSLAIAMFFGGFAMQVEGGASLSVVTYGMVLSYLWSNHAADAAPNGLDVGGGGVSTSAVDRSPITVAGTTTKGAGKQVGSSNNIYDDVDGMGGGEAVATAPFFDSKSSLEFRSPSSPEDTNPRLLSHMSSRGPYLQRPSDSTANTPQLGPHDDHNDTTTSTTDGDATQQQQHRHHLDVEGSSGGMGVTECASLWRAGARGTVQDAGKMLYAAYLEGNTDVADATEEELQFTISTNSSRYAAALAAENKKRFIGAMATLYTMVVQPCLFSFLGASIRITDIFGDSNFLWRAAAIWAIGTVARMVTAPIAAIGTDFSMRERVVLGLTWIGKATTQASLGSMALHKALKFQQAACEGSSHTPPISNFTDNMATMMMGSLGDNATTLPPPTSECIAMGEFVRRARCVELSALVCILFGAPVASLMMRKVATRWVRKDEE